MALTSAQARHSALASLVAAALALIAAAGTTRAAEVCRYAGTTNHGGQVSAVTVATPAPGGGTVLDVSLRLHATPLGLFDVGYLAEEISVWSPGGRLLEAAVNNRTLADGRPSRQQWDVFTPGTASLEGWRVQGRSAAEFRRKHPGFARHWDLAAFGQAWRQDYAAAPPERRPDLDLPGAALDSGAATPLAAALYWVRWLPPGGRVVPVVLPGFKRDARAEAAVAPVPAPAPPGGAAWQLWRGTLHHPALDGPSEAQAWVAPDHALLQIAFDVRARAGRGRGLLHALGCQGAPDG